MSGRINMADYDYPLPEERIARFPQAERDASRLLIWRAGRMSQALFRDIGGVLPAGSLLVFNNTKVIRARLVMHRPGGARVEVFCLEPHAPADYERAFAATGGCEWLCMIGNSKRWRDGALAIPFTHGGGRYELRAHRASRGDRTVRFEWDAPLTFGQLLEHLGRIPIPPYLGRDSVEEDNTRYQTVYSQVEGSVAAPTAGLHFTPGLIGRLRAGGVATADVTLHVGAGTFLPVKTDDAALHAMHTEHFEVTVALLDSLMAHTDRVAAVGTTTVRTLESLAGLGYRVMRTGEPDAGRPVGQWEPYDIPADVPGGALLGALREYMRAGGLTKLAAATRIMIVPGYRFRVTGAIVTNFHQPRSTLLLLVSAFAGEGWRDMYDYALANDFRFLSYGDSSILLR